MHPTSIHLGTTVAITLIPTPETFPMYYFNFSPNADLPLRTDENRTDERPNILTAYIEKIEDTTPGTTKRMKQFLRVRLTDISGPTIDATLWEEVLPRFDSLAMLVAKEPVVAPFTSLRVSIFKGFKGVHQLLPTTPVYRSQERHLCLEDRNKRTISDLLEHRGGNILGQTFTCQASIIAYTERRPWYYTTCPQCPRRIYQTKRGWSCGTHENLPEPKFMYCMAATMADNTAPATETFFDDTTVELIGIQCRDMVIQRGYTYRHKTPRPPT